MAPTMVAASALGSDPDPRARRPAAMRTAAVEMAMQSSIRGTTTAVSVPAQMLALRFSWFITSNRLAFSSSRLRDCTVRTPARLSPRLP